LKRAIEVFTSSEIPKRPDYVHEVASFTYGDETGYHGYVILEIPDASMADCATRQTERTIFMESRIPEFNAALRFGTSIPDGIMLAMRVLQR
jgi:hypothetical protein